MDSNGKLSTFKSVPNHFSLVSGNQEASQNATIDADQNAFAQRRPLGGDMDNEEAGIDHDNTIDQNSIEKSIEQREGGAPTAGILTATNRLSVNEAVSANEMNLLAAQHKLMSQQATSSESRQFKNGGILSKTELRESEQA